MDRVLIVISQSQETSESNVLKLKSLFKSFTVNIHDFSEKFKNVEMTDRQFSEKRLLNHLLLKYSKNTIYDYILIIKDSSIPSVDDSKYIESKIIENVITMKEENVDMCLLCSWNDACDRRQDIDRLKNKQLCFSAHADQAIIFTRKSISNILKNMRHYSLNDLASSHKIKVSCEKYNLFNFDTDFAQSKEDYYKLNQCLTENTQKNENSYFLLIIFIITLIIILLLIYIYKNYK
jgi:hypothetical protein